MLKRTLIASALLLGFSGFAAAEDDAGGPWTTTVGGALTSDYVWRGVSQTQEDFALQGSVTVSHESGFYGGVWGSNVDFGIDDGADIELDFYAGYSWEFGEGFTGDVQLVRYVYPGLDDDFEYDFTELLSTFGYNDNIFVTVGYSNDAFATDEDGLYMALGGAYQLPWWELELNGEVGRYMLDESSGIPDYTHMNFGVGRSFGIVSTNLQWTDSDDDAEDFFGEGADAHWLFTVEVETDL